MRAKHWRSSRAASDVISSSRWNRFSEFCLVSVLSVKKEVDFCVKVNPKQGQSPQKTNDCFDDEVGERLKVRLGCD